jgi:DNA-binding XRE family transcriptional regulator
MALEAGKYFPSLLLAFRIARVFGAPVEQVFEHHATELNLWCSVLKRMESGKRISSKFAGWTRPDGAPRRNGSKDHNNRPNLAILGS